MRTASVSLVLVVVAVLLAWDTRDARRDGMRNYALHAEYNREIADFLVRHREQLRGKPVAVLGVAGLSPWALNSSLYLTRLLGGPVDWDVFVPHADTFYAYRPGRQWHVAIRPEEEACSMPPHTVFLAFDPQGRGRLAQDCQAGLAFAHPPPVIESWVPKSVTPAEAAAGFVMVFRGENLTSAVVAVVDGTPLPMVRGPKFDLMTASVPPRAVAAGSIPIQVTHRGRAVLSETIAVKAAGGSALPGARAPLALL